MILVDTSLWVDHLRRGRSDLATLLEDNLVLSHPWVIGELALGRVSNRTEILGLLQGLPQATVATSAELLALIDSQGLSGLGIGYVDTQLLAATLLTPDTKLWSADKRLGAAAVRLGCAANAS